MLGTTKHDCAVCQKMCAAKRRVTDAQSTPRTASTNLTNDKGGSETRPYLLLALDTGFGTPTVYTPFGNKLGIIPRLLPA